MPVICHLGLGANLGLRARTMAAAVSLLARHPDMALTAVSRVYQSAPVGLLHQPPFLNMAVAVGTQLAPRQLLGAVKEIENALGRVRTVRWGPRTIDIDLLVCGDTVVCEPDLVVPHPRLLERQFALLPLFEIAPDLVIVGSGPLSGLIQPATADVRPVGTLREAVAAEREGCHALG